MRSTRPVVRPHRAILPRIPKGKASRVNIFGRPSHLTRRPRVRCFVLTLASVLGICQRSLAQEEESSGVWTLSVLAIGGESFRPRGHGFAEALGVAVEAGKSVSRRFEVGLSLHPFIRIYQPATDNGQGRERLTAGALDIVARWFPFPRSWQIEPFIEAAEGLLYANGRTPAGGTRFNFLTQAGLGLCFRANEQWSVVAGYRWFHISNAGLDEGNPAWNFNAVILGGRVRVGSSRNLPRLSQSQRSISAAGSHTWRGIRANKKAQELFLSFTK